MIPPPDHNQYLLEVHWEGLLKSDRHGDKTEILELDFATRLGEVKIDVEKKSIPSSTAVGRQFAWRFLTKKPRRTIAINRVKLNY